MTLIYMRASWGLWFLSLGGPDRWEHAEGVQARLDASPGLTPSAHPIPTATTPSSADPDSNTLILA